MKKNLPINQKGFTLIELVVTIGILSILSLLVIATLNPLEQFKKARDGNRKSDLAQLQRVLEQYYQDHGSYPQSTGPTAYEIKDFNGNAVVWGGSAGWPPYMNLVPKDPDSTRTYIYYASGTVPQSYKLYANLEVGPNDPQTCKATVTNCINNPTSVAYCSCGGVPAGVTCGVNGNSYPCNYGVSSPNTDPDSVN